jgi:hypothetical protein
MQVRDWQDIMEEVVDSGADPEGWRAVGGDRSGGIGEDLYIGHPSTGVFQVKTYARNPYEVQGVGARVARRVDDELDPLFPERGDAPGHFGVQKPVDEAEAEDVATKLETVVETHAEAPTSPEALFDDIMDAVDSPAYGPMEFESQDRPEAMDELTDTFEEAEALLDAEFEDVVDDDVERGFY